MTTRLEFDDLHITTTDGPPTPLVRGVSLRLESGRILGLVGESGSGKSLTCMAPFGLTRGGVAVTAGTVTVNGTEVSADDAAGVLGSDVGVVFQDPLASLNPLQRVGHQIAETMQLHRGGRRSQYADDVAELLRKVGVPDPARRARAYPHELSGGLRQRVMIAMALANRPGVVIADEPTTALDVTVQAQVLELFQIAATDLGVAILLVSHDLGVIADVADDVVVMYAGQIVEEGPCEQVLTRPQHPYTRALLASRPTPQAGRGRLPMLPGRPPAPDQLPAGCAFQDRCDLVEDQCRTMPELTPSEGGHVRCWVTSSSEDQS